MMNVSVKRNGKGTDQERHDSKSVHVSFSVTVILITFVMTSATAVLFMP